MRYPCIYQCQQVSKLWFKVHRQDVTTKELGPLKIPAVNMWIQRTVTLVDFFSGRIHFFLPLLKEQQRVAARHSQNHLILNPVTPHAPPKDALWWMGCCCNHEWMQNGGKIRHTRVSNVIHPNHNSPWQLKMGMLSSTTLPIPAFIGLRACVMYAKSTIAKITASEETTHNHGPTQLMTVDMS